MNRLVLTMLVLLEGCASSGGENVQIGDEFNKATSICRVVADAQKYDGRNILVSGLYKWEPHGAVFMGDGPCSEELSRLRFVADYRESKQAKLILDSLIRKSETEPVEVAYRATFHLIHGISCSEVNCFRHELEVFELLAARRPKKQN